MYRRYLDEQIKKDLKKKMVFVPGPRQVGKTTLAKAILSDPKGYLSWDIPEHREAILRGELPASRMLVFDEIHKYRSWRNYLKELYDEVQGNCEILVTVSARLEYYRFGKSRSTGSNPYFS